MVQTGTNGLNSDAGCKIFSRIKASKAVLLTVCFRGSGTKGVPRTGRGEPEPMALSLTGKQPPVQEQPGGGERPEASHRWESGFCGGRESPFCPGKGKMCEVPLFLPTTIVCLPPRNSEAKCHKSF